MKRKVVVFGAGNWGTTLARELTASFRVTLWTKTAEEAAEINSVQENKKFLPGIPLPEKLLVEEKFSKALEAEDWVFLVVPSAVMADVCGELKGKIRSGQVVINASKGVESGSLHTMSSLISKILGQGIRLAVLSGPTIAREIAAGEPARAVLSCRDVGTLLELRKEMQLPHLSFEMSRDVEGAELSAALKGIIAIAIGVADGLDMHTNMQGVIMTYGLREFRVIAEFLGVPEKTIYGLSGMGDLITTCISPDSRNRCFGGLLGKGVSLEEALKKVGMVVEGVSMARTIDELAHFNLDIPLFRCISRIIFDHPADVRKELLGTIQSIN